MTTSLTFEAHLAAVEESGTRLVELATEAGLDAKVPTCPAWDVRALLAHQAMVHRWATAHVRGDDPGALPAQTTLRKRDDLPEFYREGLGALLDALRTAPADLRAMRFLNDAPPPREFWARRQAHETTIHMVDALAATLGRFPIADEADLDPTVAADGIDELLR
ncbi:MAG TPA: maleylpyruvate isomerase N-terminal domain-containing protein, partial [Ilumatobacteraceae bacterium]